MLVANLNSWCGTWALDYHMNCKPNQKEEGCECGEHFETRSCHAYKQTWHKPKFVETCSLHVLCKMVLGT